MIQRCIGGLLTPLLCALTASAGGAAGADQVSITLSASNTPSLALISIERRLELPEGEHRIEFDVPASLDISSVRLSGDGIRLVESMLRVPPASPEEMLRAYVGREVLVNRKQDGAADRARQPETLRGILVSFDQRSLVLSTNNRQIPLQIVPRSNDVMEIKLLHHEGAPPERPVLSCTIAVAALASEGGRTAKLTFQAGGISASESLQSTQSSRFAVIRNDTAFSFVNVRAAIASEAGPNGNPLRIDRTISLPPRSILRIAIPLTE